jgi:hypothetical protein
MLTFLQYVYFLKFFSNIEHYMESLESYSLIQFCQFHYYPVEMEDRETVLS